MTKVNEQEIHTWERARRPFTGMILKKPKLVTVRMLERWDVCHEGIVWFKLATTPRKNFPLTYEHVEDAFSRRIVEQRFRTVWFSWLAIRVFSELSKQTKDNAVANRVLNTKLKEFMAAVTAVSLQEYPQGILLIEQARLGQMLIRIIDEL